MQPGVINRDLGSLSRDPIHRQLEQVASIAIDLTEFGPLGAGKAPSTKEKIWLFLEGDKDVPRSFLFTLFMFFMIIVSVIVYTIQSLPQFYTPNPVGSNAFFIIESGCVAIFTIELAAKFITSPLKAGFIRNPYNLVDIASVAPFYVDIIVSLSGSNRGYVNLLFLRVIRLARICRVLKLGQYSKSLHMVISVLVQSVDAFFLLLFLLFISVVLFSSLMWIAEQSDSHFDETRRLWVRADGVDSRFQSIPHSFWWCMCTLTTVGYGDDVPTSSWGKLVAAVCIIVGVFVMAFPVILISYNYSEMVNMEVYDDTQTECDDGMDGAIESLNLFKVESLLIRDTSRHFLSRRGEFSKRRNAYPEVNALVATWSEKSRPISIYFNGSYGDSVAFTHDPVFHLHESIRSDTCVVFQVRLDGGKVAVHGEKLIAGMPSFDKARMPRSFFHCKPIERMTIEIANLPEEIEIPFNTWCFPGETVDFILQTKKTHLLKLFMNRLADYDLTISYSYATGTTLGSQHRHRGSNSLSKSSQFPADNLTHSESSNDCIVVEIPFVSLPMMNVNRRGSSRVSFAVYDDSDFVG
eukprot:TRINITY_DN17596_c0_g1_i1.p1 TRINITY_DN17596_c0_g1~~TRINITY_DN17596_c0_g1_i1.p1  ORF type:complete len:579 (+),score=42.46 TRINITY_DN17596_c0_g1_i1:127-1863(+)